MGEAMRLICVALAVISLSTAALAQPAQTGQGAAHPACTNTSTNHCHDKRDAAVRSTSDSKPGAKSAAVRNMYGMSDLAAGGIGGSGRR